MNHLTHSVSTSTGESVLNSLSPSERQVALASVNSADNPRVNEMNNAQCTSTIDNLLLKASVKLGQKKKEGEEYKMIFQALNADLMKFPNLTVREIYLAVDNGLDGKYTRRDDEIILFTPSNFVQWIRAYIEETKKPVMKKTSQVYRHEEEAAPAPSERESLIAKYRILLNACIDTFETGVPYQDYGGVIFDLLTKIELIQPVEESEMKAAAQWILNNARDQNDKTKINQAQGLLQKVLTGASDESVLAVASRKKVERKLKLICAGEEADVTDFLELSKSKLQDYLAENLIE